MKDIMGMMGKVKELQSKMEGLQEEIANLEVEGTAGGGIVTVTLSGKGEMRRLKIDPSVFADHDAEVLEDLVIAAHNMAKAKAEDAMREKQADLTAGLPIPPGMKLPF